MKIIGDCPAFGGFVELNGIMVAPIVGYATFEGMFQVDDEFLMNVTTAHGIGGQVGLAGLGGMTSGNAILSDDDLSDEPTFRAKASGCDDLYSAGTSVLLPPDLSLLALRYRPAYIEPIHEASVSATGGIGTFLRNVDFDDNEGRVLWDQATVASVRQLPRSVPQYWTTLVFSSWQAEEPDDDDPNSEAGAGSGLTLGISTHGGIFGTAGTTSPIGDSYTGICTVFLAVVQGEPPLVGRESHTVAHEVGHTFGLDHPDGGLMCGAGVCQTTPFTPISIKKLREYIEP